MRDPWRVAGQPAGRPLNIQPPPMSDTTVAIHITVNVARRNGVQADVDASPLCRTADCRWP
jgi:hypothetical protein